MTKNEAIKMAIKTLKWVHEDYVNVKDEIKALKEVLIQLEPLQRKPLTEEQIQDVLLSAWTIKSFDKSLDRSDAYYVVKVTEIEHGIKE